MWAGAGAIEDVIAERILTRGESLYEEPLHLLREEQTIRTPGTYFDILRAIAAGTSRYNEIAQQAGGLDHGAATKMLGRLGSLGYIELREPLGHDGPIANRGVYRIADPFFRFWFRYVFPSRSRLERGRVQDVCDAITADLDSFMGLAFEDACREWVGRYADELPSFQELGKWWDRRGQTEIDVVATARRRFVFVGSCKWSQHAEHQRPRPTEARRRDPRGGGGRRTALHLRPRLRS